MSDYDITKEDINSSLQGIITAVTTLQEKFIENKTGHLFRTLGVILLHANNINEEILPNISNTEKLHNLSHELNNIETIASSLSRQNEPTKNTNKIYYPMQDVLKFIKDINTGIINLKNNPTVPTPISAVPESSQLQASTEVDLILNEIGLSTRVTGYYNNPRAWINILFEYRLNKKIEQLLKINKWEDCQFIGGFDIPKEAITQERLTYLEPSNVLSRLNKLATNNIVAVSELVKTGDTNVTDSLQKKNIFGCVVDVGFVSDLNNLSNNIETYNHVSTIKDKNQQDLAERRIVFKYNNTLKILNIHLPSDGPKGKPNKKPKSISDFISDELKNYIITDEDKLNINVICGDTNITTKK
jgi:hypothetical protein